MYTMLRQSSPQYECQEVLQFLRSSNLVFLVQESPYSAYVTIRKRHRKDAKPSCQPQTFSVVSGNESLSKELHNLKESHAGIETINVALKADLADATEECDGLRQNLKTLENIVDNLHLKLKHYEAEQLDKPTIRTLQIKNEKLVAENKLIRNEMDELKKETNIIKVALKSSKKELHDTTQRSEKRKEMLESKIKDLTEFKVVKTSEEKEIKHKLKKIEKQKKSLIEKETQIKVDRINLERLKKEDTNHNVKTDEQEGDKVLDDFSMKSEILPPSEAPSTLPDKLEMIVKEALKIIEDVPDEEMIFTAEEIATFGLDWRLHEEMVLFFKLGTN